jgi:formate dehydrogenase iron-sulfur subunit
LSLPLLERAREGGTAFVLLSNGEDLSPSRAEPASCQIPLANEARIPARLPGEGEQYRFHFDMTECIGCQCCVVACNEQNGNPADIHWRRVGEIEGGSYPDTWRSYLSMGCNHCLEPTCMEGCPVEAFTKDPATGLVLHSEDACIGCQYCTWNCSYGVPQFNAERGVVGKCDMCHGRLAEGREPACVHACPEGAIAIEIVNIAQWREEYALGANAPGMPSADDSLSTTRLTLPATLPRDTDKVNAYRVRPEDPHWPLVAMTALTQLSVGALAAIWLMGLAYGTNALRFPALLSLAVGILALGASTLHLGRPIYAYRALKMWRRSWLSREVLLFSIFSGIACLYAASLWMHLSSATVFGALTAIAGISGIFASAQLYRVPARPAWNSFHTTAEFFLTALLLGPLFVHAMPGSVNAWPLRVTIVATSSAILLSLILRLLRLTQSPVFEMKSTGRLLCTTLAPLLLVRIGLLMAAGIVLPLVTQSWQVRVTALIVAIATEITGRYLFFVSVVPKNIAAAYLGSREAA